MAAVVKYEKNYIDDEDGNECWETVYGLYHSEGYYLPFIDYDLFESTPVKVPEGFVSVDVSPEWISKYICGAKTRIFPDNDTYTTIKRLQGDAAYYYTHDNGGRPFLVYVHAGETSAADVYIYCIPEQHYVRREDYNNSDDHRWAYIHQIAHYKALKVWIGESTPNPSSEFSGGIGKEFDGNSILIQISEHRYAYIGKEVYEFNLDADDEVVDYYSSVGNNDVPYPVLWSKKYIFFMLNHSYVPVNNNTNTPRERSDVYTQFYGHHGGTPLSSYSTGMNGLAIVAKRRW